MSTGLFCPFCGVEMDYEAEHGEIEVLSSSPCANWTKLKTCFTCVDCGFQFFVGVSISNELRKCSEFDMFKFIEKIAEENLKQRYTRNDVCH